MTGLIRFALVVSALLVLGSQRAAAQSQNDGAVTWSVRPVDAIALNEEPGAYRVFGSSEQLTLILILPAAAVREQIRLVVHQGREIPVVATWAPGVRHDATEWTVLLSRADRRPFSPGRHVLDIAPAAGIQRARLRLDLGPPVNARERATALRVEAQQVQAENPSEAITLLHLALATDPASADNSVALGDAYVQAGRYLEAIPFFERAIQIHPRDKQTIHHSLAFAYIGTGDDIAAVQTLRAAGISESAVTDRLARYRQTIGRR